MATEIFPNKDVNCSQEKGRKCYLQEDYTGAVKAFTEAAHKSKGHMLLGALDCRAASYEKLHDFQQALRDGKTMIETMPENPKGYLRVGKVLRLKGQKSLALQIYDRGLKKVKIATQDRALLLTMRNKLRYQLDRGKSHDPLKYLPLELVQMVCQNLEIRDRVICLAVTKEWKELLESLNDLWTTLDTTYARKAISSKSLKAYLRRSNYTVNHAIITGRACIDEPKMKYLTDTCKKLRIIEVSRSDLIGSALINALPAAKNLRTIHVAGDTCIRITTAQRIMNICQDTLAEVRFDRFDGGHSVSYIPKWPPIQSLRKFSLWCDGTSEIDMDALIKAYPNLTYVAVENNVTPRQKRLDLTHWAQLAHLDLRNNELTQFPKLPVTVTTLLLDDNSHLCIPADEEKNISPLPLLEALSCYGTSIDVAGLLAITRKSIEAGNLNYLCIGPGRDAQPTSLVLGQFPVSETVKTLSLLHMSLDDALLLETLQLFPALKKLDLQGNLVTGVSVRALIDHGIQWIGLRECHNVSLDAVDLARGKGIHVKFDFPSSGRRDLGRLRRLI